MLALILILLIISFTLFLVYSPRLIGYRLKLTTISAVVSSICLVLGIILLLKQDQVISAAFEKRSWPTIQGKIIQTQVLGERAFRPEISYQYQVNDIKYVGSTDLHISGFGNKRSRRDNSEKIIQEYSVGSNVLVYYDSKNPQISYLRTGPFWSDFMKLGFGAILFFFGSFVLIGGAFRRK